MSEKLFSNDLLVSLCQWVDNGDRIILGIDLNEDICSSALTRQLKELGLREVIITHHGEDAPATYQQGRRPIDGIFVSSSLPVVPCGYLAFGAGIVSDHCPLWVDLPLNFLVGTVPKRVAPRIRRLQCRDPHTVTTYLNHYRQLLDKDNIPDQVARL